MPHSRIALPLDFPSLAEARPFADRLSPHVGVFKVGLELFTAEGPAALHPSAHSLPVFLDLKLHDIPETVERAVGAAAAHGVRFLTVHASGGFEMLRRAASRAERSPTPLTILAVTVLTSLGDEDLRSAGVGRNTSDQARALAALAWTAGIRGFVCSPREVAALRRELGPQAILFVPGVRPTGFAAGDQQRVGTPAQAIEDGADFLVIGRPIRDAPDPVAAARSIASEIGYALSGDGPTMLEGKA